MAAAVFTPEQDEWMRANPGKGWNSYLAEGVGDHARTTFQERKRHLLGKRIATNAPDPASDTAPVSAGAVSWEGIEEPSDEEWEQFFALLEGANDLRALLGTSPSRVEFSAPDDGLPVAVAFTGDWHCGAGGVEYGLLRRDLDLIRDTPGLYAVLMGDALEGVSTHSKAAPALYSGLFSDGRFQEKYVVMRAVTCAGKWLAMLSGNHDEWIYKNAGISRMDQLAAKVGAPHFGEGGGTVVVRVGGQEYVIGVRHNAPGNSRLNTSNPIRRLFDDWPEWENAHILCIAHFHYNDLHVQSRKGGHPVTYLRSGTYKLHDSYAKAGGFTPEYGVPMVVLKPDTHEVVAWRGNQFLEGVEYLTWLRAQYAARQSEAA